MVTKSAVELNVAVVRVELESLVRWLSEAVSEATAAHDVERALFQKVLEMGKQLFGAFLTAVGNGDRGAEVTLSGSAGSETRVVKRFATEHRRRLLTVFGEFTLSRCVYGVDERQAIELAPTDQRLQLPESAVSYLLQEWDQLFGIEQAFGVVRDSLNVILRIKQSVDTLERGSRQMAESAAAFREQQPAPDAETEGELLIVSEDNKAHTVDILDLLHVLPRLWTAAHLFHKEGNAEATAFVRQRLLRVLQGQAKSVIADLRRQGTTRKLQGTKKQQLRRLTEFLETNLQRMRYDEYLAAGYPIATGVIEGACRQVIKDRMERTGMRWKIPGAQALLELRTIHTNGDWDSFHEFRITQETQRLDHYSVA